LVKKQLIETISEIENSNIVSVDNNYTVSVRKDDSVYAYAPRRFAHAEQARDQR